MVEETQESSSSEKSQTWEISQYETALAQLELLQEQIDALRSTIPSLVAPLMKPATSKAQMFADIRNSALQSTHRIHAFREKWDSEQTQQMFAKSKESFEKSGDLSKAGDVARYGWSEQ